jgi:hypothetical protein
MAHAEGTSYENSLIVSFLENKRKTVKQLILFPPEIARLKKWLNENSPSAM